MIINVDNEDMVRIDKYLIDEIDISRSKIQKLINDKRILVNDKEIKNSYTVKMDDVIYIDENYEEKIEIEPVNIPLDIIYEDDYLLAVNKRSGMVVHPACGHYNDTLVNALMYHCNNLSNVNGAVRPGIIHRIDADTSGLLLVAKNDDVHLNLAKQIQEKKVERKYLALVHGVILEDTATIDAPIGRDEKNRKKMCVTGNNSKEAITHVRVLERYFNSTLIECILETGRTHQIRVHMNYINHPIVNDPLYGIKKQDNKLFGQMLHAKSIGFIHPVTDQHLYFECEEPQEFKDIVKVYKEEGNNE